MTLFEILDAFISADDAELALALPGAAEKLSAYADNGCDTLISNADAERIVEVGRRWLTERASGNGEFSRMRDEARDALE